MDVNADTYGLVRALLRLDEADRSNIVEHLPPRKVKNAFLLLFREIAGLPSTSDITTFGELANPILLVVVLQEQPLAYALLAMHPVSAHEPVFTSNKRSNSTAISNDSKRARIDATVAQNAEQRVAQIIVKKEDIIEITSDAGDAEAETDVQPKAKDIREPADLEMYLRISSFSGPKSLSGPTIWTDMYDLPDRVRVELERRSKEMWSLDERSAQRYAEFTHNTAKYMHEKCCINSLPIRYRPGELDYGQIAGLKDTACGVCTDNRRPCAYFAKYMDRYVIYLVPLAKRFRKGKHWTQIGYWVKSLGS
ncbi:hypothetical protein AG0111_0g8911 [Alternaria gaisen]|uniref:Uncharacterized protein n=1 Tax=Alternaria gaisen TaxID=167740 RepID=A0ACB6FEN2_9PLEO|nr:hypothetical protein AG0111_0g8911 [Alternaria gaisen]